VYWAKVNAKYRDEEGAGYYSGPYQGGYHSAPWEGGEIDFINFKNRLAPYENIPLNDKDLYHLLGSSYNLVLYPELNKYNSIDELLGNKNACILHFTTRHNYGHWACFWKLNSRTVSFFNSYGGYPDDALSFIPKDFAAENHENYPYLSRLLDHSPYRLTYSATKYQKHSPDIKTCGRHVAVRLMLRDKTDGQYFNFIKKNCTQYHLTPDELVTLITMSPQEFDPILEESIIN
jgi:hypothetical protein